METRNQKLIRKILGEDENERGDHSLSNRAFERAVNAETPRTMTPWDWEQWYSEHGVPEAFINENKGSNQP